MVYLKKEDLKKIWGAIKPKITPEDREWLESNEPGVWAPSLVRISDDCTDIMEPFSLLWEEKNASSTLNLCARIENVLDAKANRKTIHLYTRAFLKKHLLEIARLLNLDVAEKTPYQKIIPLILQKIEEESN